MLLALPLITQTTSAPLTAPQMNNSVSRGEEIPPRFSVQPTLKRGGAVFPNKYYAWNALLSCARVVGQLAWTQGISGVLCDSQPFVVLKFTSNNPPKPVFQTRTTIWSLLELFNYWAEWLEQRLPRFPELSFFTFLDSQDTSSRLGIGQVVSGPATPRVTLDTVSVDSPASAAPLQILTPNPFAGNGTLDNSTVLTAPPFNVGLYVDPRGGQACSEITFHRVLLKTMVAYSEYDFDAPIPFEIRRYYADQDFTFKLGATSHAAAEEGTFTVKLVLDALYMTAIRMQSVEPRARFHDFEGKIVIGPSSAGRRGTRLIGKISMKKGDHTESNSEQPVDLA